MFCPKCHSLLNVDSRDEDRKLKCDCGFSRENKSVQVKEVIKNLNDKKGDGVVDETKNELAVFDHKCEKCGYGKAQLIERGIQYSDEDDMTFYKCGRCGHMKMLDAKVT